MKRNNGLVDDVGIVSSGQARCNTRFILELRGAIRCGRYAMLSGFESERSRRLVQFRCNFPDLVRRALASERRSRHQVFPHLDPADQDRFVTNIAYQI